MYIKTKVSKLGVERRILELPKSVRDNFSVGQELFVVDFSDKKYRRKNGKR